jgi:PAS domain S-box-containing protein
VIVDITDQKHFQNELAESEERFLAIFTNSAQGILLADPNTKKLHIGNPRMAAMLGYSPPEISKLAVSDIHPLDAMPEVSSHFETLAKRQMQFSRDVPVQRRDGSIFYADINVSYVKLKGKLYAAGFFHDITSRKQAQDEAKGYEERLRSLALELSLAEERERRRLAGHLHDEVAQLLSLAQIRLSLVQPFVKDDNCRKAAEEMQALLGRALQSTRSLTFQMSHPALYDLGFAAGAEWLAEDVSKLYGIQIDIIKDDDLKPLDLRLRIVLFQCLRELLVNAAKHARVNTVSVRIGREGNKFCVVVSDNGAGFDPERLKENTTGSGFGLFSIRERLRSLGGNMEIHSEPQQGTTTILEVPV